MIFCVVVSLQPELLVAIAVIVNEPAALYVCAGGFCCAEVFPFGKLHDQVTTDVSGCMNKPVLVSDE